MRSTFSTWLTRVTLGAAVLAAVVLPAPAAHAVEINWTGSTGHASNPAWSPDGQWLAFEVNNNANKVDLFVVQVQGGVPKVPIKVTIPGSTGSFTAAGSYAANPNWHPRGPLIFEASNAGGLTRLYFLQPGGSSPTEYLNVAAATGNLSWPTISPDGAMVAFVSGATGQGDVYVFNATTGKVSTTFASGLPENAPRFSPDGKTLVFSRNQGTEDLFTWAVGTTVATPLTGGSGDQSRPRFAGTDRVVFFTNERGDDLWDIAIAPAVPGRTRTTLARDIRLPLRSQPQLTPDGTGVVYTSSAPSQGSYVFVTTLDGVTTKKINTGLVAVGDPSLTVSGGRTWLAFTALPNSDSDWRQLHVIDVTGQI